MSAWRTRSVFLALLVVGCGSGESASSRTNPDDPFGGQTGSLEPPTCGIALDESETINIPAGGNVFVVQAENCGNLTPADVVITGPDGEPVPVELVPLGDGRYLARAGSPLDAGQYTVAIDGAAGGSVDLQVNDAAPLPSRLGMLRQTGQPWCGAEFALELDVEALPYASLLRLRASLDGAPDEIWIDYGLLAPEGGEVALGMDCCLYEGSHHLVLTAEMAGESVELEPVEHDFEVSCASARDSSCALPARASSAPGGSAVFFALFGFGLLAWRRAAMKVRRGDS